MPEHAKYVEDHPSMGQLTLGNVVSSGNHVDRANTPPSVCGDVKAREKGSVTDREVDLDAYRHGERRRHP
jgi:hypothetical protein